MSEIMKETLIKRKNKPSEQAIKCVMIVTTIVMFLLGFMGAFFMASIGVLLILICYFVFPYFDIEYEYSYVTGFLDIDKIIGKKKRKRLATLRMEKLILLVPSDSQEAVQQMAGGKFRKVDYTSGNDVKTWTMFIKTEDDQLAFKLELDDEVVQDIARYAPHKVKQS